MGAQGSKKQQFQNLKVKYVFIEESLERIVRK